MDRTVECNPSLIATASRVYTRERAERGPYPRGSIVFVLPLETRDDEETVETGRSGGRCRTAASLRGRGFSLLKLQSSGPLTQFARWRGIRSTFAFVYRLGGDK